MSLFSNFPQGGKKAGVQSISDGGTGATTAEAALANLGGFPKADGEALKTRIQPINLGGTGASEANQARQNLGAAAVKEMTKAEYDALAAIDPTIFYALTDVEADGVKIEVGSYVGTGKYGSDNPNTLTFGFNPKIVYIYARYSSKPTYIDLQGYYISLRETFVYPYECGTNAEVKDSSNGYFIQAVWDNKTLSWWAQNQVGPTGQNASSAKQHNSSGVTYNYIAIG